MPINLAPASSVITPIAPDLMTSSMKPAPWAFVPGSATNRSPVTTLLESEVIPVKFNSRLDSIPMKFASSETDLT